MSPLAAATLPRYHTSGNSKSWSGSSRSSKQEQEQEQEQEQQEQQEQQQLSSTASRLHGTIDLIAAAAMSPWAELRAETVDQ